MERPEASIERLPDCLHWSPDGEIRVVGHRVGLYSVVDRHHSGHPIEEILAEFPTLSLNEIRSIVAFYQANHHEVGAYVREYRDELRRQEEAYVPSPAVLRIRRLMEKSHGPLRRHESWPSGSCSTKTFEVRCDTRSRRITRGVSISLIPSAWAICSTCLSGHQTLRS